MDRNPEDTRPFVADRRSDLRLRLAGKLEDDESRTKNIHARHTARGEKADIQLLIRRLRGL